ASNNLIRSNVISGNSGRGVEIDLLDSKGNRVQGNLIGTDATGNRPLGNMDIGIFLANTQANIIGGAGSGLGNVIASNKVDGIHILDGGSNLLQGNLVGTNAAGTVPFGNGGYGILIGGNKGSPNNTIGGTAAGAGNIIAGNKLSGILLAENATTGTLIQGN